MYMVTWEEWKPNVNVRVLSDWICLYREFDSMEDVQEFVEYLVEITQVKVRNIRCWSVCEIPYQVSIKATVTFD